jgi:CRP-like cAMP-binding protein
VDILAISPSRCRPIRPSTALEEAEVWAIDGAAFLRLLDRHPPLARAVIAHLAGRVLYFIGLVEDLSLRSVEARLASTLLKNAERREGRLIVPRRQWTTFDQMAACPGTALLQPPPRRSKSECSKSS